MSYEGYEQFICTNGHYGHLDAFEGELACRDCLEFPTKQHKRSILSVIVGLFRRRQKVQNIHDLPDKDEFGERHIEWINSVDETNGDSYGRVDIEQFVIKKSEYGWKFCWNRDARGFVFDKKSPALFRVPSREETIKLRTFRNQKGETSFVNDDTMRL